MNPLKAAWLDAGITPGSTLLLHSDLRRLLFLCAKAGKIVTVNDVLTSLLEALGPEGTLLLPTFNFNFSTHGSAFDIRLTPSQMGILTETARLRHDAVRTGHPVYSFVALGGRAMEFSSVDNYSAFGGNSPFAMLHNMGGYVGCIGLPDQDSMTFYHHVEEMCSVPWRHMKRFTGPYVGWDGMTEQCDYAIYVRNDGVVPYLHGMEELMWERGLYKGDRPNVGTGLRLALADDMFKVTTEVIATRQPYGMLYRNENG